MKTIFAALALGGMVWAWTGCVSTVDGKHQGGVPFVKDKAEGRYERSVEQVMKAGRDTIAFNGVLTVENVVGKTLEGKVDKRTVWMAVVPITPTVTSLTVQVRTSGGGTDMELANYLREQVAVRLASGNLMPATGPASATPAR